MDRPSHSITLRVDCIYHLPSTTVQANEREKSGWLCSKNFNSAFLRIVRNEMEAKQCTMLCRSCPPLSNPASVRNDKAQPWRKDHGLFSSPLRLNETLSNPGNLSISPGLLLTLFPFS